jgi:hypothetical protein
MEMAPFRDYTTLSILYHGACINPGFPTPPVPTNPSTPKTLFKRCYRAMVTRRADDGHRVHAAQVHNQLGLEAGFVIIPAGGGQFGADACANDAGAPGCMCGA